MNLYYLCSLYKDFQIKINKSIHGINRAQHSIEIDFKWLNFSDVYALELMVNYSSFFLVIDGERNTHLGDTPCL